MAQVAEVSGPTKVLPCRLGRYMLLRRLGIGGMAEVFLAEQEGVAGFKKQCVVKKMLPHLAEQDRFVEMFLREARTAAELQHPNIVQIWDLGEAEGSYFIAMEYIDGIALNTLARTAWRANKSMPVEVVCCALADAALGLSYAHQHQPPIVHRDVSPDNLIIDKNGDTRILDFGIARVNDGERTGTGELKGKIPFMSPEQLRGEPLDGRADLWALGVSAYWMLTGKRPFGGATELMLMQSTLNDTPVAPNQVNPHIPDGLNALVVNLLEKKREARLASAQDLHEVLEHTLSARRTTVAPFVRKILELPAQPGRADPASAPSGFVPATPHTDTVNAGWRRLLQDLPIDGPPPSVASALEPAPTLVNVDAVSLLEADHRRGAPLFAIGAALALLFIAGAAIFALWTVNTAKPRSRSTNATTATTTAPTATTTAPASPAPSQSAQLSPQPTPAAPPGANAPAPTPEPKQANAAPPPAVDVPAPTIPPKEADGAPPAAVDARERAASSSADVDTPAKTARHDRRREITVHAPAQIDWRVDGKSVGSGSAKLKVPANATHITAVDKKRGGKTTVAIADDIDYAKFPHGKLQARAKPLATVFLGSESLGDTPFPDVDVVAGSYSVQFVYKDKQITKTIEVGAGSVARALADFTAP